MNMLNQKKLTSLVFGESRLNKELESVKWNVLGHVYEPIVGGDQQSSFAWISNDPSGRMNMPLSLKENIHSIWMVSGQQLKQEIIFIGRVEQSMVIK